MREVTKGISQKGKIKTKKISDSTARAIVCTDMTDE